MIKKILVVATLAITPLLLSSDASAQCYGYGGYGGYGPAYGIHRAPVVVARVPHRHHHHDHYRGPVYRSGYRGVGYGHGFYGSPYGRYGSRYGGFYGSGIGVGRGGFSLRIGF
jgi:hypothetical protein